jgi:hypothetical protein
MKVSELTPGDLICPEVGGSPSWAVFITSCHHPLWPGLRLVIWRMPDGSYSFDALMPGQEVGVLQAQGKEQKERSVRWALGLQSGVPTL